MLCSPPHTDCPACWTRRGPPLPGPTELPGLAAAARSWVLSSVLIYQVQSRNVGAQLLVTTSSEVCLVLRGCLPCLSPLLPDLQVLAFHPVGQVGLEGLLGKQSLGFFHADIPALPSGLLIPAGG